MTNYTPGPWHVEQRDQHLIEIRSEPDEQAPFGRALATVWSDMGGALFFSTNAEADAHLMAAAPKLLEALQEITRIWDGTGFQGAIAEMARAAIAKALGQEETAS